MIGCERKRLCRSNSKKNCCYFENSADFLCVGVTSGNVGGAPGKKRSNGTDENTKKK